MKGVDYILYLSGSLNTFYFDLIRQKSHKRWSKNVYNSF